MTPPKFRHGQLRLVLLTLIARRPQHGYELIQELSELFNGNYAPSAGTIYPRLAKLESEGLVTKHDDGRKTVYAITPEGQTEVDARADEFAQIIAESAESIAPQADSARDGLMQARLALRNELDWLASELRSEAAGAAGGDGGADGVAFDAAGSAGGAASATDASLGADGAGAGAAGASAADAAGAGATGASSADAAGAAGADDEAEQAQPTPDDLVREVDQLLQRFRQDVRQDARLAARSGSLVSEAVTDLGHSLGEYARRFAEQVGIHRR